MTPKCPLRIIRSTTAEPREWRAEAGAGLGLPEGRLHGMAAEAGQVVDGTVTKLAEFGVFVRLPDGQTGLVHISEIADAFVRNVADYFEEGDTVKVKVLGINDRGRLELSAKQAEPRVPLDGVVEVPRPRRAPRRETDPSFEDRLSKFLKSSEQRLALLRRSRDAKKRKRGRR